MSVHPSLSSKGKSKRSRSVLKRFERVKHLEEKEKRKADDSVFGLPKVKAVRWKLKKTKKAAEAEAEKPETQETKAPAAQAPATKKKEEKPPKK